MPSWFGSSSGKPAAASSSSGGSKWKFPTELPVAQYPNNLKGRISKELAQGLGELLGTTLFLFCGFGAVSFLEIYREGEGGKGGATRVARQTDGPRTREPHVIAMQD